MHGSSAPARLIGVRWLSSSRLLWVDLSSCEGLLRCYSLYVGLRVRTYCASPKPPIPFRRKRESLYGPFPNCYPFGQFYMCQERTPQVRLWVPTVVNVRTTVREFDRARVHRGSAQGHLPETVLALGISEELHAPSPPLGLSCPDFVIEPWPGLVPTITYCSEALRSSVAVSYATSASCVGTINTHSLDRPVLVAQSE